MYKKYVNKRAVPEGFVYQLLLIMRLTTIILIMAIMQVSASTFAQRITLSEKNATLRKVFDHISDQSGYNFIFTTDLLKHTKPVTINVKNTEMVQVLNQVFLNQPVSFSIEEKTVVIKTKEPSFLDRLASVFANIDVHGRVLDEQGNPLIGASVTIKGTTRSVRTESNGEFALANVDEKATLIISFLGYGVKEVGVKADLGTLIMTISTGKLDEVSVVSTGYQILDRTRSTGSFDKISKERKENPEEGEEA